MTEREEDKRLAATVKRLRTARGWDKRDLAEAAGVYLGMVTQIENAHLRNFCLSHFRGIAKAFNLNIFELSKLAGIR